MANMQLQRYRLTPKGCRRLVDESRQCKEDVANWDPVANHLLFFLDMDPTSLDFFGYHTIDSVRVELLSAGEFAKEVCATHPKTKDNFVLINNFVCHNLPMMFARLLADGLIEAVRYSAETIRK